MSEARERTPDDEPVPVLAEQPPLRRRAAARAVARSVAATAGLLARRRIRQPGARVGVVVQFADGSAARVYRETVVPRPRTEDPAVLVVEFRLRGVRGRGHALFRAESLLNTPLFVGFPGFVSKLWLAHDEHGAYRGLYEWDGPGLADAYVRALWWVLSLVSVRGSIHYAVLPGIRRDDLLDDPGVLDRARPASLRDWWRPTQVEPAPG
ncbi:MAG TPA: hypothetical protein VFI47_20420 [Acidimicrobiales bacterium]|nr:hypothetical protein [Acidimicrobiales bacterium]